MRHWLEDGCRIEFSNGFCSENLRKMLQHVSTHSIFLESTWFHTESTPVFLFSQMCQKLRLEECFMIEMIEIRLNALGNSLKIMKNTRKQFRTLSMAFHDVQILSLPDMFLQ